MHSIPLSNAIALAAALLAVGGVFIAFILSSQKKHQARMDLLRYAVERGMTLDVELIDKISSTKAGRANPGLRRPGRGSLIAGILTVAYGIGFSLFAVFIGSISKDALIPMLGVGTLCICVGIGLLIVSRILRGEANGADPKA